MARARNVKPSLFENEILGMADPLCTLLFIGLWTLADCEGRLEDRPLRIKAQLFPYRNEIDIEKLLEWLHKSQFIYRYSKDGANCIQIINFCKHQNPHKNEKSSELPPFCKDSTEKIYHENENSSNFLSDTEKIGTAQVTPDACKKAQKMQANEQAQKVAQAQDCVEDVQKYNTEFIDKNELSRNYSSDTDFIGTAPADSLLMIPDSLNLIPDSLIPPLTPQGGSVGVEPKTRKSKLKNSTFPALFLQFWEAYPKKCNKDSALKAWNNVPDPAALLPKMLEVIRGFAQSSEWKRDGGRYIPYPATWLNNSRWEDEIPKPMQYCDDNGKSAKPKGTNQFLKMALAEMEEEKKCNKPN